MDKGCLHCNEGLEVFPENSHLITDDGKIKCLWCGFHAPRVTFDDILKELNKRTPLFTEPKLPTYKLSDLEIKILKSEKNDTKVSEMFDKISP